VRPPSAHAVRVLPFGEAALLVQLGDSIDEGVNAAAHALGARLRLARPDAPPPVPAYASVLVAFDPGREDPSALADELERAAAECLAEVGAHGAVPVPGRLLEVPVRYGGENGPDLAEVAARAGLAPADVVALHAGTEYRVFMLGFVPGFAYLGPLPRRLELPRRPTPRARVAAGSVAIAARQTAVYPISTPGGWHILGRTQLPFWDAAAEPPALLRPGDRVRFVPS
jgi:KipI family sensor histidine kinase inhibitor